MKNKIIYGILGVILFVAAYFLIGILTDDSQYTSVPFETVSIEYFSGVNQKNNVVIKNQQEWLNLWSTINSQSKPLPIIDFETEMIIADFMGGVNGGGSTEIIKLEEDVNILKVTIEDISPADNCTLPAMPFQPSYIIKTKKTDKEIEFKEIKKIRKC